MQAEFPLVKEGGMQAEFPLGRKWEVVLSPYKVCALEQECF